jgi:DNA helicase-2/ATP-dependent DNA helicase PcrA
MSYLKELNPQQREAVEHGDGPLLILAGAGSGKTKTVTTRVAHLINKAGVKPGEILAVTFTNKAAREMRERIEILLGKSTKGMWIATFHSMCARILREHIDLMGYKRNFNIIDSSDSIALLKACMKDLNISERLYSPRSVLQKISSLKGKIVGPDEYAPDNGSGSSTIESKIMKIYPVYQERLRASNALDFDDLLMLTVQLLMQHQNVNTKFKRTFKHIMVDEYQDTNQAQYMLIKLLCSKKANLCVVGDDDQSIYRFRGADLRNILEFEKDFSKCKVVKLEQNYRSTQCILDSAWALVCNNPERKPKKLWTDAGEGEKVWYYRVANEEAEALQMVSVIKKEVSEGRSLSDYAVLYRTNTQARTIEEAFRRKGVPYRVVGGMKFYDRKEIKDVLSYLRVIANPNDSVGLKRIINTPPRGIGEATLKKAAQAANPAQAGLPRNLPLIEAVKVLLDDESLATGPKNSIRKFMELLDRMLEASKTMKPSELARMVLEETNYFGYLKDSLDLDSAGKIDNINEMIGSIAEYEESMGEDASLEEYLVQVALVTDWDNADKKEQKDVVTMMTLHLSKGLEFPVVFIAGVEEGLIPHAHSNSSDAELEEERRLLYVGMTRARQKLVLFSAVTRKLAGLTQSNRVSRFIEELPESLLITRKVGIQKKPIASAYPGVPQFRVKKPSGRSESRCLFKTGASVDHPTWGGGVIEKTEGKGDLLKLTVQFGSVGRKKLMARMANLKLQ